MSFSRGFLLLALGLSTPAWSAKPSGTGKPTTSSLATADLGPVYFEKGAEALIDGGDYMRAGQALQRMKLDPKIFLVLVGSTDSSGNTDKDLALSQQRAEYVRSLLMIDPAVDGTRIYAVGVGAPAEKPASSAEAKKLRRVEFVFHY